MLADAHGRYGAHAHLFTTAPVWFFEESLAGAFTYHETAVDVGFRQASALVADVPATVEALRALVPFDTKLITGLARKVRDAGCTVVLCDIAPLGVAVAEAAGLPSVLVENFSWPWLYEPLLSEAPELEPICRELDHWSARASVHLQARPVCARNADVELVDPVSREARLSRPEARRVLGIDPDVSVVVVTMGGYGEDMPFMPALQAMDGIEFVVTGTQATARDGNVHGYDNRTPLFMPDVLRAADALVAKLGYGIVSEAWREGLPLGGVTRPDFREMASLEAFCAQEVSGRVYSAERFRSGAWLDDLPELLAMPRRPHLVGGAARIADVLVEQSKTADV